MWKLNIWVRSWFNFCWFADLKLVSGLIKSKATFCLLLYEAFWTFCRNRVFAMQSESTELAENSKSWTFFIFLSQNLKYTAYICRIIDWCNPTRMKQSLSILASLGPCCCLSSKKLSMIQFSSDFAYWHLVSSLITSNPTVVC